LAAAYDGFLRRSVNELIYARRLSFASPSNLSISDGPTCRGHGNVTDPLGRLRVGLIVPAIEDGAFLPKTGSTIINTMGIVRIKG
jgi:hypothetical protein